MGKKIKYIVLHISDSSWGTAMEINNWHQQRGWKEIGYHEVILNGFPTAQHKSKNIRDEMLDGSVEIGRELDPNATLESDEYGAQVKGFNSKSMGICCIAKTGDKITSKQMEKLRLRVAYNLKKFDLPAHAVRGHSELDPKKPYCPGINLDLFRKAVQNLIDKENKKEEAVKPPPIPKPPPIEMIKEGQEPPPPPGYPPGNKLIRAIKAFFEELGK